MAKLGLKSRPALDRNDRVAGYGHPVAIEARNLRQLPFALRFQSLSRPQDRIERRREQQPNARIPLPLLRLSALGERQAPTFRRTMPLIRPAGLKRPPASGAWYQSPRRKRYNGF